METREHKIKRLTMRSMRRGIKEMDLILMHYAQDKLSGGIVGFFTNLLNAIDAKLQTAVSFSSLYSTISQHKLLLLIVPKFF